MKKMKKNHLHEERYYLIRNCAVARNPIFISESIQSFFKEKMEDYLSPISKIIAYSLKGHEFKILLKLASREVFDDYYQSKIKDREAYLETPESTYIFSQVMSNLQVSLVKRINHKYNRSGTLMAGRFKREEITSSEEVMGLVEELNKGDGHHSYSELWMNRIMVGPKAATSEWLYAGGIEREILEYLIVTNSDLVGSFKDTIEKQKITTHGFHARRLFASLCRYNE